MNEIIFLMGPTASGKTSLAIELYKKFPVEIISVDSAQVYRGLDIGTAKPSTKILKDVPHYLIDICDVRDAYSVGRFIDDALEKIEAIILRGKVPLLVGGTGLYFRSLETGIAALPPSDLEIRSQLDAEREKSGSRKLHEKLQLIDPESSRRIHENDPQRIQRALEIYEMTGLTMTEILEQGHQRILPYCPLKIVLCPAERQVIHKRVDVRFKEMLNLGLVEEVEHFYQRHDIHAQLPAMKMVGYRQIWHYLEGSLTREEMIEKSIIATRQLAKRQMTWLRSEQNCHWFDGARGDSTDKIMDLIARGFDFEGSGQDN